MKKILALAFIITLMAGVIRNDLVLLGLTLILGICLIVVVIKAGIMNKDHLI